LREFVQLTGKNSMGSDLPNLWQKNLFARRWHFAHRVAESGVTEHKEDQPASRLRFLQ
jgi:hypothetical protein